ncbi:tRNA (guanosine(37)-N1)-methyltransferase TrmD [Synechococcus sp. M16CYN]
MVSLAPQAFAMLSGFGVVARAFSTGIAELHLHNPRTFATDRYRKVDDKPYGGGVGMVLKPEPVFAAMESVPRCLRFRVLLMSPQGRPLRQNDLQRWSTQFDQLIFLCGHYEGFDERIRHVADEEVSVGDFVLTGGELPAMTIINGVVRLLPGTVGTAESLIEESHSTPLLEHPQYTRPADFRGMKVPAVLRSGDHDAIASWRQQQREIRTKERRPDLFAKWQFERMDDDCSKTAMKLRIGNGYDIHRLVRGRELIIGGVSLEHPDGLGLDGHSDADVLVHAVMDALLGALSLGDIGKHFPPTDSKWRDANSLILLEQVVKLVKEREWRVVNIDAVLIAERPKLNPHLGIMRHHIAKRIGITEETVSIKATTNEKLGPEGREEGISCHAIALLQQS